jgi:YVTN family beta-propeller protein
LLRRYLFSNVLSQTDIADELNPESCPPAFTALRIFLIRAIRGYTSMKKKPTAQPAPARHSLSAGRSFTRRLLGEGGFFNLRTLIPLCVGLLVLLVGLSIAAARSAQVKASSRTTTTASNVLPSQIFARARHPGIQANRPNAVPVASLGGVPCGVPLAYISNYGDNTVSVIDTSDNTVVATVPVGSGPFGVAVNPDGTRAYVTNIGDNTVSVIDTSDNTIVAMVSVGTAPRGVAVKPDGTRVYVTNINSDTVSVIDASDNTVVATIPVPSEPRGVAVKPDGTRAYVANYGSDMVSVIDTSDNTVVATIPGGDSPVGVAVNPDGTRAYVTNIFGDTVSVIDTSDNTVVATIPVGRGPFGVAVNPGGTRAYVANFLLTTVSVIDTSDNTVVATVPVGLNPLGVAVNPDGTRAYVANYESGNVSVIDTANNTVVATVPVGFLPAGPGKFIGVVPCLSPTPTPIPTATLTPTATPTPGSIMLRARRKRINGINSVRLKWRGATSANVDVYRNSMLIVTTPDDGQYDDSTGDTGQAQYVYRVCDAGTQTCSNDVTVNFPP